MVQWCEIAGQASRVRYQYLSDFLNGIGFKNKVDFIETTPDGFTMELTQAKNSYQQIRIGSPFGERVPNEVDRLPATTLAQKSADSLVFQEGQWWARSMLTEGLIREVALIKKLDISDTALIIGAGASSRAVIAALLKIGFHKFNITEKFEERGRLLIQDLRSTYFNVDLRFTPAESLTLLPGIHSIVVNTTPLSPTNDVLNELYYCNFLKLNGVVIDLTLFPIETPLLKATAQVGGRAIPGIDVATLVDSYWVNTCFGLTIDQEKYKKGLKEVCDAQPVDLSQFEIPEF